MTKYLLGLFLVTLLAFGNVLSSSTKIFEDHKLQTYAPFKAGIKDMLFDIRMDGLVESVRRTTSLTQLEDLYFRVYWAYPGQYKIVVEGLPKGFRALKLNLESSIKPIVDLIFADEFIKQFERVPFTKDASGNSYVKQKSGSDVNDIKITLNSKNILEKIESKSPYSRVVTDFNYIQRSWSNGKHVMSEIKITESSNGIESVKNIGIDRELVSGAGMPKVVTVGQELLRGKKAINKSSVKYNFSNYVINTGKALRILKGQKN